MKKEYAKIKMTRNTVVDGNTVAIGDVVETEKETAQFMCHLNKAVIVNEEAADEEKPAKKAAKKK